MYVLGCKMTIYKITFSDVNTSWTSLLYFCILHLKFGTVKDEKQCETNTMINWEFFTAMSVKTITSTSLGTMQGKSLVMNHSRAMQLLHGAILTVLSWPTPWLFYYKALCENVTVKDTSIFALLGEDGIIQTCSLWQGKVIY